MLLKELLSLRNISHLKEGLSVYNIETECQRKVDLIKILEETILMDDFIILNMIRLTERERNLIIKSLDTDNKIKVTDSNLADILNIDSFLYGLFDNDYYLVASDIASKIKEKNEGPLITSINRLHAINKVLAYASNFFGIFDLNVLYKMFMLNPNYKNTPLNEFSTLVTNLNEALNYYTFTSSKFISHKAKDLKEEDFKDTYNIPSEKEIDEYFVKHYLKIKELEDVKKHALQKHTKIEAEIFLRLLFDASLTAKESTDLIGLTKAFFLPQTEEEIKDVSTLIVMSFYYTPKLYLKGHRLV